MYNRFYKRIITPTTLKQRNCHSYCNLEYSIQPNGDYTGRFYVQMSIFTGAFVLYLYLGDLLWITLMTRFAEERHVFI